MGFKIILSGIGIQTISLIWTILDSPLDQLDNQFQMK